eukprot:c20768_g9_i1.p1 GENE.c20768_g9_i1~~c20768_g9_i1.p1  ORF type:complete len:242 (+),score=57.90 c20768_g9_i1:33-758(+)
MSDEGKLIVLGLSWNTTEETMREYMSSFGDVRDVQVMRDRATGRARGFGFVTFVNPEDVKKVLEQKEHSIDGRKVEPKQAVPKFKSPPSKPARIFVAKLPLDLSLVEFRRYFDRFGEITDAYLPKDHTTGAVKGFGFVSYADSAAVEAIMLQTTHELGGKQVVIDRAEPDARPSRRGGHVDESRPLRQTETHLEYRTQAPFDHQNWPSHAPWLGYEQPPFDHHHHHHQQDQQPRFEQQCEL